MNESPSSTFWSRFRRWKAAVVPSLVFLGLFLMRGEPSDAPRWRVAIALVACLGAAYVIEEVFWIAKNRGRPCGSCGNLLKLRPFSLRTRCDRCGALQ